MSMDYPCIDTWAIRSRKPAATARSYLALNLSMEQQIAETLSVCDLVRGHRRSPKKLWLSFDEWNVWYRARSGAAVNGARQAAPHLLEEIYNLEDALLVGGFVNTLLRNADRVKLACLAQLVNVIAPIMTNATGMYRQTIYYPYGWGLQYAHGTVLNVLTESPTYEVKGMGVVPYLDVTGRPRTTAKFLCLFSIAICPKRTAWKSIGRTKRLHR